MTLSKFQGLGGLQLGPLFFVRKKSIFHPPVLAFENLCQEGPHPRLSLLQISLMRFKTQEPNIPRWKVHVVAAGSWWLSSKHYCFKGLIWENDWFE